jgi:hypothetical protein
MFNHFSNSSEPGEALPIVRKVDDIAGSFREGIQTVKSDAPYKRVGIVNAKMGCKKAALIQG